MEPGDVITQINGQPGLHSLRRNFGDRPHAPGRSRAAPVPGERNDVLGARPARFCARRVSMSFRPPRSPRRAARDPLLVVLVRGPAAPAQQRRGGVRRARAERRRWRRGGPRWRRHVPMLAFALALAVLIVAAARPQRSVAEPVDDGVDHARRRHERFDGGHRRVAVTRSRPPSRPPTSSCAKRAEHGAGGPARVRTTLALLQSPTTDHALRRGPRSRSCAVTGGTAIGDALLTALHTLATVPREGGKQPPGAIVLLSDGASDVGSDPITAAQQAAADHIPIYTVELGTAHGTSTSKRGNRTITVPVPAEPGTARGDRARLARAGVHRLRRDGARRRLPASRRRARAQEGQTRDHRQLRRRGARAAAARRRRVARAGSAGSPRSMTTKEDR